MSESLTATLRSIDKASAAIEAAISAGGSAVGLDGCRFDLSDDSALVTAARARPRSRPPRARRRSTPGLAGRSLGAVTSIAETVTTPQPVNYYGDALARRGRPTSIPIPRGHRTSASR